MSVLVSVCSCLEKGYLDCPQLSCCVRKNFEISPVHLFSSLSAFLPANRHVAPAFICPPPGEISFSTLEVSIAKRPSQPAGLKGSTLPGLVGELLAGLGAD